MRLASPESISKAFSAGASDPAALQMEIVPFSADFEFLPIPVE